MKCPECGSECVQAQPGQCICFNCGHGVDTMGDTEAEKEAMGKLGKLLAKVCKKLEKL